MLIRTLAILCFVAFPAFAEQYLVQPDLQTAQTRSALQCANVGCDRMSTMMWWATVPLADGRGAVVIQPSGPFGATATLNGVTAGLTGAEIGALQTPEQLAGLLPSGGPPNNGPSESTLDNLLRAGLTITSTANPGLNGIYAVDPSAQIKIAAVAQYISTFNAYPAAQKTLAWRDTNNGVHLFPADVGEGGAKTFLQFARVVADFVVAASLAQQAANDGSAPSWPAATATIP